jgi:glycosyltransferase involved in cell wall biosynthesis
MRILFLGYWSLHDPLTIATIFPHLRLLQERADVEHICLVTIERDGRPAAEHVLQLPFPASKISFQPLISNPRGNVLLTKTEDFTRFPNELIQLAQKQGSSLLLARGAPAGALAYLVWRRTKLPFYVESYEPHGQYMREAGVWSRFDPRYLLEQYWERLQKKYARALLPVAENYRRQLIREGVPADRIITVPCSVDLEAFAFSPEQRQAIRQQLGWPAEAVVGVYVGKFGGIYYDQEAFALFRQVADFFGAAFHLLILTPLPATEVQAQLATAGLDATKVHVAKVPFAEVPGYLSAADFAFGLHRPTPFVSPIKNGEYWASGLPILLTEGVGDDSGIIKQEGGGAVFNLAQAGSIAQALAQMAIILQQPAYRADIRELAVRHRSVERAREAYQQLFSAS